MALSCTGVFWQVFGGFLPSFCLIVFWGFFVPIYFWESWEDLEDFCRGFLAGFLPEFLSDQVEGVWVLREPDPADLQDGLVAHPRLQHLYS